MPRHLAPRNWARRGSGGRAKAAPTRPAPRGRGQRRGRRPGRRPDPLLAQLPGLRRYATALVGNAADADDLVQDCIERALAAATRCAIPRASDAG